MMFFIFQFFFSFYSTFLIYLFFFSSSSSLDLKCVILSDLHLFAKTSIAINIVIRDGGSWRLSLWPPNLCVLSFRRRCGRNKWLRKRERIVEKTLKGLVHDAMSLSLKAEKTFDNVVLDGRNSSFPGQWRGSR